MWHEINSLLVAELGAKGASLALKGAYKGGEATVDFVKRLEIDPDVARGATLGSDFGNLKNLRLKPKKEAAASTPHETIAPTKGTHPLFPHSTQIEYGEGLSAIAKQRRLTGGVKDGPNLAVVEYVQDGVTKTRLFKSVKTPQGSLHSEDVAAIWLKKQGVDPNNVKRLYSEYHPCVRCDPNVRTAFPNAEIEFTWPYKSLRDSISKVGRDAKMEAIRRLRGE